MICGEDKKHFCRKLLTLCFVHFKLNSKQIRRQTRSQQRKQ